ncbi:MAG: hypothetical protein NVV83_10425 [Afipia sp.]|nr:hypothetical protein [Afipia sp.]
MDKTKKNAAGHSLEAFALLQAARSLRRAALDLRAGDAEGLATKARALAKATDDKRRRLMSKRKKSK